MRDAQGGTFRYSVKLTRSRISHRPPMEENTVQSSPRKMSAQGLLCPLGFDAL